MSCFISFFLLLLSTYHFGPLWYLSVMALVRLSCLFFFVLFEIRCNIFLCVCYYHYHYYHQIIIFFKFTHLIHACWVGQLHGNFSKVVWTIAISAEKFLSTIPFFFFFHYWKRAGVLKSRPAIWVNTFHYFYLYGPINWGKISPNSWIDVSTSFLLSRTK